MNTFPLVAKRPGVQHLYALCMEGQHAGVPKYEVIGCIAGRRFGVRREDIKVSDLSVHY